MDMDYQYFIVEAWDELSLGNSNTNTGIGSKEIIMNYSSKKSLQATDTNDFAITVNTASLWPFPKGKKGKSLLKCAVAKTFSRCKIKFPLTFDNYN